MQQIKVTQRYIIEMRWFYHKTLEIDFVLRVGVISDNFSGQLRDIVAGVALAGQINLTVLVARETIQPPHEKLQRILRCEIQSLHKSISKILREIKKPIDNINKGNCVTGAAVAGVEEVGGSVAVGETDASWSFQKQ